MRTRSLVPAFVFAVSAVSIGAPHAGAQPVIASDNVELVGTFPDTFMISGEFARTGEFFYVSSTDSITVFDTSNPTQPLPLGTVVNAVFENESMTYGERMIDGELRRWVMVGVDLFEVDQELEHVHVGFDRAMIVDVTDPMFPDAISSVDISNSAHTVQCVDQANCEYAYSAGDGGEFSIIDLRDLEAPVELKTVLSPASGPNEAFGSAGHYWEFDGPYGWHTGSGGAAVFDVSDPTNPIVLNATDGNGIVGPYNDFILHNSRWPNYTRFQPNQPPSVENGNVLLITEEDYANQGDEISCDLAGTFQTWHIPDLDGEAYRAGNPDGAPSMGNVTPLDITNAPNEFGGGTTTPAGGFCSAHWFDYHQTGIVALANYQQGVRFMDVRDAANIDQYGFWTPAATEAWDAYWVPERDDAGVVIPGRKTNLVYVADFVRGIDVLEVTLPEEAPNGGGPTPTGPPTTDPTAPTPGGSPTTSPTSSTSQPTATSTTPGAGGPSLPTTGAGIGVALAGTAAIAAATGLRRRRHTTRP